MTTRPGEIQRIKQIVGGDAYREEVLTLLAVLNERSERQEKITQAHSQWQIDHDKKDEVRFAQGDMRMSAIEKSLGGAVSGVNTFKADREKVAGMWKALTVVAAIGVAVLGAFAWIWDHLPKGQP